jgi:hypothetical protein
MPFYLTPKQDDFNKIPEIQVCIAEACKPPSSSLASLPSEFTAVARRQRNSDKVTRTPLYLPGFVRITA